MASIIYSALVESIRGSIGGTTFQKNAYGYTVKKKPNMLKPWTEEQLQRQIFFAQSVRAWKTTTAEFRANWDTWSITNPQYSKKNPSAVLSGFACFVKWHVANRYTGGGIEQFPELVVPALPELTFTLKLIGGVLTLACPAIDTSEDWSANCYLSNPLGSAQNFIGTKPRYMTTLVFESGSRNITTRYQQVYGSLPIAGDRIGLTYTPYMAAGGQVNANVNLILTVTAV